MEQAIVTLKDKKFRTYLDEQKIQEAVGQIGRKIDQDYIGKNPLFVCILSGSFMFTSDLVKNFTGECEITFVRLSSYHGTETTGNVKTLMGMVETIENRDIIIVEDIVDTGNTLSKFLPEIEKLQPKSIKIVALLVKPDTLKDKVKVDYRCFDIPNDFIVGYGLDYDGLGRNLRDIYVIC
jgi:hypoxanthine phosphoribosyltransferase